MRFQTLFAALGWMAGSVIPMFAFIMWMGGVQSSPYLFGALVLLNLVAPVWFGYSLCAEEFKRDADRYRFIRNDDNWWSEGSEPDRWLELGEASHSEFDAIVDSQRERYRNLAHSH